MAPAIANSLSLSYPGEDACAARRLEVAAPFSFDLGEAARAYSARVLGSSSSCSSESYAFCNDASYDANTCATYNQELVTTTIFAVAVSSAALGFILFVFGHLNLTRYVSFVPTSISEAFLSCVGYKVFAYALKFCKYKPQQFLPAAFIGVLLYFMKALHIGNPAVVIPALLLVPLAMFHAMVAGGVLYDDIDAARADNVMFPYMENVHFWTIWTEGVFDGAEWKFQYINLGAWASTLPDLITMIIVVMIDCLLKVKNTENKLPVVPQPDYETKLYAACNALMTVMGSPCGYMQLKFNVINFGIMGNARDRRGGIVYALLCAVCFFWTIAPFNYLPRFFLGMLLFFAGTGFVAENLWGSRKNLSFYEWLEILFIFLVFIVTGQLIYAVAAGILITAVSFIGKYARVPVLKGKPIAGGDIASYARRGPLLRLATRHIANAWFLVVPVKGYVFFASAKKLAKIVQDRLHVKKEFEIVLDARCGGRVGGDVVESKLMGREALRVTGIVDGSLLAAWNEQHPKMRVQPGDHIVEVTCARNTTARVLAPKSSINASASQRMRQELARDAVLHIKVSRQELPSYMRTRFVIFDCGSLDGMDASAADVFRKLAAQAQDAGATFLWTNLSARLKKSFLNRSIITNPQHVFGQLDHAVLHIEERILRYREGVLQKWLLVHPGLAARHDEMRLADSFEPFTHVFETDAERRGCPWMYCSRLHIKKFRTVLWGPGMEDACLFLVHSGAVGIYKRLPQSGLGASDSGCPPAQDEGEDDDDILPTAVYEHGWFLNREFILQGRPRCYGIAIEDGEVLAWNREQWCEMSRQRPLMAAAIVKAVMRQQAREVADVDPDIAKDEEVCHCPTRSPTMGSGPDIEDAKVDGSSRATFAPHLPPETRQPLLRLATVRALEQLGLWSAPGPDDQDPQPAAKLPNVICEDLCRAFTFYCEQTSEGPRLDAQKVNQALMFAGVFGVELNVDGASPLSQVEFIALAHEALIARLSRKQKEQLLKLFNDYDTDCSGTLDRHELPVVFQNEFAIRASEIDSVAREVDHPSYHCMLDRGDGQINQEGFLWIVARLVRKHEKDFMLLQTLRGLTGNAESTEHAELTLDMLRENSRLEASDQEWQEMIWAMDLSAAAVATPLVDPKLDFSEIMTMVIAQEHVADKLPSVDSKEIARGLIRQSSLPIAEKDLDLPSARKLVVDQRSHSPADYKPQAFALHEESRMVGSTSIEMHLKHMESADSRGSQAPQSVGWRVTLHKLLEEPDSSPQAYAISIVVAVLIILSIVNIVAASLSNEGLVVDWKSPFWVIDFMLVIVFTIEYAGRAVAFDTVRDRTLRRWVLQPRNLLDFCAILPVYVELAAAGANVKELYFFRVARLLRIAQVARMSRLSGRCSLAAPVATVLMVIWGIYLKEVAVADDSC